MFGPIALISNCFKFSGKYYDRETPLYKITNDQIVIYYCTPSDDNGYFDTSAHVELIPTCKSYNLIYGIKKRILVSADAQMENAQLENAILAALIEDNKASHNNYVRIQPDGTLLVSSEDWNNM